MCVAIQHLKYQDLWIAICEASFFTSIFQYCRMIVIKDASDPGSTETEGVAGPAQLTEISDLEVLDWNVIGKGTGIVMNDSAIDPGNPLHLGVTTEISGIGGGPDLPLEIALLHLATEVERHLGIVVHSIPAVLDLVHPTLGTDPALGLGLAHQQPQLRIRRTPSYPFRRFIRTKIWR